MGHTYKEVQKESGKNIYNYITLLEELVSYRLSKHSYVEEVPKCNRARILPNVSINSIILSIVSLNSLKFLNTELMDWPFAIIHFLPGNSISCFGTIDSNSTSEDDMASLLFFPTNLKYALLKKRNVLIEVTHS